MKLPVIYSSSLVPQLSGRILKTITKLDQRTSNVRSDYYDMLHAMTSSTLN